ncbi:HAAS domain-containing protein [Bacillus sp. EB01]|uniref:HAAS domain-containing protein n=1 Tax=Bacillus sp. EB01 TaxID=1347086 RepID=UPI003FA46E02
MLTQPLRKKEMNEVKRVEQLQLSEKSRKFIDDLRLYLFSSGKNDQEIKEIAEELEDHLYEAEVNGKSIDRIIGRSPKEYMMSISSEMKTDYKAWAKYVPPVIIGAMSYFVFGDLLQGTLNYSLLKIAGTVVYCILFLVSVLFAFRFMARNQVSKLKEFLILLLPTFIGTFFFGGIIIADSLYPTPIIHFGTLGSIITGVLFLGFVVIFSIRAKTTILPVVLIALHLPTLLLSHTSFSEITQLIVGWIITYLLIIVYLFFMLKKEKG